MTAVKTEPPATQPQYAVPGRTPLRLLEALSFRRISALYIFVGLFVIFSLLVPDTFLRWNTWRDLMGSQSITAIVAVALVLPLAAGSFNLAVGAEVGMGAILSAWLLSETGAPVGLTIILTIAVGALIGLVSALLIVKANVDSFIATLGISSVLLALIQWLSGGQQILDLGSTFQELATRQLFGIVLPFYFMLVLAGVVWYVLERTPAGRRLYATGGSMEASRLAGVRVSLVVVLAFVASGMLTAFAGLLVSSNLATGDPTVGPAYLLPAFAAVFLGSTQFKGGRYNVWGTVVAVYVLAAGVKGLQLAGAPVWIPELFNGLALLAAVSVAKFQGTPGTKSGLRNWRTLLLARKR